MKEYIIKIALLVLIVVSVACESQLEEYNPSGITDESIFTKPDGFESAVNAAYTYNRYLYGKEEGYGLLEVGTDIWTNAASDQQTPLSLYLNLNPDQAWLKAPMWQQCYAAINVCNTALSFIGNAGLTPSRQTILEGEIRFMRAWYYWHLVETFGDVPFSVEPTVKLEITATRTPVETIYEQIFKDLNIAIVNLPPTTTDYGRVTKPAAEAFLARLYLTRNRNQEACNVANRVIKNYGRSLLPKYADLWQMANQRNTEVLWATNYSTNLALNAGSNVGHAVFLFEYKDLPGMKRDLTYGTPTMRYMPTLFLLNLFDEQDDARYSASFTQAWIANNANTIPTWTAADAVENAALASLVNQPKFTVGDTAVFITKKSIDDFQQHYTTRYRYRVYDVDDLYNSNGVPKDRFHYPALRKFTDPTRANENANESSRDAFLIRLAEMYLIVAEAKMKLGDADSAALMVNAVRTRAAIPGHEADMQVASGDVTLDFILDERAREFAGEDLRWFDLKRTGKLVERIQDHNPDAEPNIKTYHILRPIPQAQIDAVTNKDEFFQNEGYY